MPRKTEAQQEMEKIFGFEGELNLNAIDRMRLKLVESQYTRSNLYYRLFFDKTYRPDRFNCIVNEQATFKNKNEFRTHVLERYFRFPVASTSFMKLGGHKSDFAQQTQKEQEEENEGSQPDEDSRQNALLEKRLLRFYNRVFLGELSVYGFFFLTVTYLGSCVVTGYVNMKVANSLFMVPGIATSSACYYLRNY